MVSIIALTCLNFCHSYVSRLVDGVDPAVLEAHSDALGQWLTEATNDVTPKLSSRCCELLYQVFKKSEQWSHVVELFVSCKRYVHELGLNVCEPLDTALQRLGPVTKLISAAEILTEEQMARMSSQVMLHGALVNFSSLFIFVLSSIH